MDTFQVLADPTRRNIVELLAQNGQLSATEISDQFKITPAANSQQLKVLRESKLVNMEKKSQQRLYQINPSSIEKIEQWVQKLKRTWENRFEKLDKLLARQRRREVK